MPSMMVSAAAGLMAFSGLATAFPQGGFHNATGSYSNSTGGGSAQPSGTATSPVTESLFCPALNGDVVQSHTGADFLLACGTNHFGVVIDVASNSTLFSKRQAPSAPSNIQDCLLACDGVTGCTGTAFDTAARTCTLFSSVGAAFNDDGVDFAIRVSVEPGTPVDAGATLTSTIYSQAVVTIASCAPTVTDCPLRGAVVVTQAVPVTSTDYVCPSATVVPAAPVACKCAFSASVATIYSTTNVGGSVTVVPVATSVIAVPSPTGTGYSTTTGAAVTGAPTVANVGGATGTATGSTAHYTGAAANLKAGMGLVAGVAGFAFML